MAFRYTPTPTPSITPTISLTPSISPTITATSTVCPGLTPTATSITPTPTPTSTNTTPTPTMTQTGTPPLTPSITPPVAELYVYAKYRNEPNTLQYLVNGGEDIVISPIVSTDCEFIFTITGLSIGDVVIFTTTTTCIIALDTSSPCPNSGFACSQTYTFPGGSNFIYITVDGSICC